MKLFFLFSFIAFLIPLNAQTDTQNFVTQKIKYQSQSAGEVYLIWGINDWKLPPPDLIPEETEIINGTLQTQMTKNEDSFFIELSLPEGTELNYMFHIIKNSKGNSINIWDTPSEKGYLNIIKESNLIEIKGSNNLNEISDQGVYKTIAVVLLVIGLSAIILLLLFRKRIKKYEIYFQNNIVKLIVLIIISRVALFTIGYFSIAAYNKESEKNVSFSLLYLEEELTALARSDVQWYLDIAENGYDEGPIVKGEKANWAFYPLWPIMMKALNFVISDLFISGLILCNLIFIGAAVIIYKLILMNFNSRIAYTSVFLLILFPTSYFFMRPGPESLFLLIIASTFLFAKKEKWIIAGIFSALAVLTRFQGILIVLPLLYIYYNQWKIEKKFKPGILSLGFIPIVVILFMLHLELRTGDMLASFNIQKEWDHQFALPFTSMINFIASPSLVGYYGWNLIPINFLGMFFSILLVFFMFKSKTFPIEFTIYTILSLFVILSRNDLQGSLRYILPVFPIFIILAELLLKKRFLLNLVLYLFVILQAFYFIAFVNSINWAAN